ncbi:MAG: long-chain fatty acid--CoA ligase [Anaerolineaceae bacterium]|nr:long-chain fatty acid--CoA ligase [Anaerolineaceae bacterium]
MDEYPWLKHYPQSVPSRLNYPDVPLQQLLADATLAYPGRVSLSLNEDKVTYQELERLSDHVAGSLVALGVKPGERVGLFMPNLPEFVIGFFGILKAGGVAAAFNPLYQAAEFIWQARDAGVGLVISDAAGYPLMRQIRQEAGLKQLVVAGDGVRLAAGDLRFSELRIANNQALPQVSPDDPVIYQYSGGTTGVPKGVIATHRNLLANALQFRAWLWNCWRGEETLLAAIPLYHVYGMLLAMCLGMVLGATVELVPNPRDMKAFQAAIQRARPTILPAVPGLLGMLANLAPDATGVREMRSLKVVISGAAPLPDGVRKRFEKLTGVTIAEGYGLSEAPTATHCNPIGHPGKPGTIGFPLPDVEARVVSLDDEVTPLPSGQAGELVLRGPQVMQGYLNNPQETSLTLREGWLYTGDIAVMDKDGYFKLVDRKKDMIKSGGLQVWPREVEDVLLRHPAVADAGVAGFPDDLHGEAIAAWVVLKEGKSLKELELRTWCKQHMAYFKIPHKVTFVEKLPRSGVGKLLRRELRNLS